MLPPRLIRGRAARVHLLLGLQVVLAVESRAVVVGLVIVPDHEPGTHLVRGPQRGVALVLAVARPIAWLVAHLESRMPPGPIRDRTALVDVIAEMRDEIEILAR